MDISRIEDEIARLENELDINESSQSIARETNPEALADLEAEHSAIESDLDKLIILLENCYELEDEDF